MSSFDDSYPLDGPDDTMTFGRALAALLQAGDVVALYGDLGAGKTTLSRGVISGLMGDAVDVPSPTYTLVQTYDTQQGLVWHFDLYRLSTPDEVFELGWEDTSSGICLIEWPEKAGPHLPSNRLDVILSPDRTGRIVRCLARSPDWECRLNELRDTFAAR